MTKKEIILTVITVLATLGIIAAIIITAVNSGGKPEDTTDPIGVTDTTEPDTSGDSEPEPPKDVHQPDNGENTTEEPDIDVGSITRPKEPGVIGGDVEYDTKE